MDELNGRLEDRQLKIELTHAAKQFVIDQGYDPVYGARSLRRYLQKHVETLVAQSILGDEVGLEDTVKIDVVDHKLQAVVDEK